MRSDQRGRVAVCAPTGVVAAAAVAYLAAVNHRAWPQGAWGPLVRAVDVLALIGAASYAWLRHPEERLGRLMMAVGFLVAVWMLHGAGDPYLFTLALVVGIVAAPAFLYLLMSFPEGRLHSRAERRLAVATAAMVGVGCVTLLLTSRQPAIALPWLHCVPRCPRNVVFVGSISGLRGPLSLLVRLGYATLAVGVAVVLIGRLRDSSRLTRLMLTPAVGASLVYVAILAVYLVVGEKPSGPLTVADWLLIAAVPAVPLAAGLGLAREHAFLNHALQGLVAGMPRANTRSDLHSLMRNALDDANLRILYWSPSQRCYIDIAGAPAELPASPQRSRVLTRRTDGARVAAVVFDATLADEPRFITAVTAAAAMVVDQQALEAELRRSRRRVIAAADRERERLERNLHDGSQATLVAISVKLAVAREAIESGSPRGADLLHTLDDDLQQALDELRQVAHGLYPHLLAHYGLPGALQAAARRAALPTTVSAKRIGRYDPEVETAVYFCCLEALQNAGKHAGADAGVSMTLWREQAALRFEVKDDGCGFDQAITSDGVGLQNIRDRTGAIGGAASIRSAPGQGTTVSGGVPVSGVDPDASLEDPGAWSDVLTRVSLADHQP